MLALHPAVRRYLETGETPHRHRDQEGWWKVFALTAPHARDRLQHVWTVHRDTILRDWTRDHPGTRPYAWWEFDAPAPRRRLSGIGDTFSDQVRHWGIPADWAWVLPMHKSRTRVAVSEDDPPTFESEATFLDRHGLLSDDECRRSPDSAWAPLQLLPPAKDQT